MQLFDSLMDNVELRILNSLIHKALRLGIPTRQIYRWQFEHCPKKRFNKNFSLTKQYGKYLHNFQHLLDV